MIITLKEDEAILPAPHRSIGISLTNVACPNCGGTGRGKARPSTIHAAYSYEKRPGGYQMPEETDEELMNQCRRCYGMGAIEAEISLERFAQLLKEIAP